MPGSMTFQGLYGDQRFLAYKFDDSAAYDADRAFIWVRKVGTPGGVLTLEICADSTGDPGAVAKTVTLAVASGPAFQSELMAFWPLGVYFAQSFYTDNIITHIKINVFIKPYFKRIGVIIGVGTPRQQAAFYALAKVRVTGTNVKRFASFAHDVPQGGAFGSIHQV